MKRDFRRIAVVNRGQMAARFIHSAREFDREHGTDLRTIAFATDVDRAALFVREADEIVWLGASSYIDPRDQRRKSRYLDGPRIKDALREAHADAAWLGWSFVPEHLELMALCEEMGVRVIGPEPSATRLLRDKWRTKELARSIGIPVIAGSDGPVTTLDAARRCAGLIGLPIVVKAIFGGGGRTLSVARSIEELEGALPRVSREAEQTLGHGGCYLEAWIPKARLIGVEVLADSHGHVWDVGVREASVQRRFSKFLDECPPQGLSPALEQDLRGWAVALVRAARYEGVAGVEFLVDASGAGRFLEVNPRLETAHDVIEATTGLDLVKEEIFVARGGELSGSPPAIRGHAFEVLIRANDPGADFAMTPGVLDHFRPATGPGIRVEASVADGDEIVADYSSLIAKLIAHGRTRSEALARLERALSDTRAVVRGGSTNKSYLLGIVQRDEVRAGAVDLDWLDRVDLQDELADAAHVGVALVVAAIELYDEQLRAARDAFLASAARGRPAVCTDSGAVVEVIHHGRRSRAAVARRASDFYRIEVAGRAATISYERRGRFERRLAGPTGRALRVTVGDDGTRFDVDIEGASHRVFRPEGGVVRAPVPGIVQSIAVKVGDPIERGDDLAVIEAMKMELCVVSPLRGRVRSVFALSSVPVPQGAPLFFIEGDADAAMDLEADARVFDEPALAPAAEDSARDGWRRSHRALRQLMLGFDVDAAEARRVLADLPARVRELGEDDVEVLAGERELIELYVNVFALVRRQMTEEEEGEAGRAGAEASFFTFLRSRAADDLALPREFVAELRLALAPYGVDDLGPSPRLDDALYCICRAQHQGDLLHQPIVLILERWMLLADEAHRSDDAGLAALLESLARVAQGRSEAVANLALEVSYRFFERPLFDAGRRRASEEALVHLEALRRGSSSEELDPHLRALVECPYALFVLLSERFDAEAAAGRHVMLTALAARYYRAHGIGRFAARTIEGVSFSEGEMSGDADCPRSLFTAICSRAELDATVRVLCSWATGTPRAIADLHLRVSELDGETELRRAEIERALAAVTWPAPLERVTVVVSSPGEGAAEYFTFRAGEAGAVEDRLYRGLHPMMAERIHLDRLREFTVTRLAAPPDVYLFRAVAKKNPKDERLFAFAEVRDLTPVKGADGSAQQLPHFERVFREAVSSIRTARTSAPRLLWNRIELFTLPANDLREGELRALAARLARTTAGAALEKVVVHVREREASGAVVERALHMSKPPGMPVTIEVRGEDAVVAPLSEYEQRVVRARQRGLVDPYEIMRLLAPPRGASGALAPGEFTEYDLEGEALVPVSRPPGRNSANMVAGIITNFTQEYPEGMTRVVLLGDPSKSLGSLAEPECRRVLAALALARQMKVPLEWFTLSSGAKIAMDSGTENMDWIAAVLRGLIEFTQAGGEVNVVVMGINVGGQPYWNGEATMLMHTRGILVMLPQSAMVLTGKRALDYSGGVSAEDDFGIGGYERIMGVNGQAQYFAHDLSEACRILLEHYELSYVAPAERFPRRAKTSDPFDRDVCAMPHGGDLETIGDVFSSRANPGRKKPFHIRKVMAAAIDQDHLPLERWRDMRDAENVVVWDARIGGIPVCLLGIESEPIRRRGHVPADGPETFTGGTLFPFASKKMARAINAASDNRPVVVLANLSGFDGSPESMRNCQLEFGSEIGRAVVNFRGPIVFCVVSRFHGGAYVVFSHRLNENLEVAALEGTYASVIGGAAAAGVVFAGEVSARAKADPRIKALEEALARATDGERRRAKARLDEAMRTIRAEYVGILAEEFDREHSVERALRVGSLHKIIPSATLRPYLIDALERGMSRELARSQHA